MILLPESIFSNKVKIGRREYGLVKRVGVTVVNKKTQDTFIETRSGKASRKKVAVLLDVVQMRVGGRPLPKIFFWKWTQINQGQLEGSFWGYFRGP